MAPSQVRWPRPAPLEGKHHRGGMLSLLPSAKSVTPLPRSLYLVPPPGRESQWLHGWQFAI